MRETPITTEKAEAIFRHIGRGDEFAAGLDYYIRTTDSGSEELWEWGGDEPLAVNAETRSWTAPGWPTESDA